MPRAPSSTVFVVLLVLVLVAGSAAGGYLYYTHRPASPPTMSVVALHDNVTVNYIGIFGSGPEAGRVFDTSVYAAGSNGAAYPKSLQFHDRGVAKNYTPLAVHVGSDTPSAGYTLGGLTFIQVVPGFWQGLLGIYPNQTHTIVVPPALGYGPVNAACVAQRPIVQTLPVLVTMPGTAFQHLYPGLVATTGAEFSEPHYGWPVLILSANSSFVTLENLPTPGWTVSPAGWPVVVSSVTSSTNGSGTITLVNDLSPSMAGHLLGKDFLGTGPCSSTSHGEFILTAVDLANGTYTENYNQEVQGQTLLFVVSVVDLFAPIATPTI